MMMFKRFIPISISPGKFLSKRQKFILTAILLSGSLLAIEFTQTSLRYQTITLLSILSYFLSAWCLSEGLSGVEWLTVLILPTFYTAGIGLFYFLVPSKLMTRLPIILFYGVGFYILLLAENIFSVAAIRTIQLLRSAQAVGFLLTLVTSFFLFNTIFSFRLPFWTNFFWVGIVSFFLILGALWSVNLEDTITSKIWSYSLALALIQAEIALAFSFWPLTVAESSLSLTTSLYIILGLGQHQLAGRLFKKTINEYITVGIAVFLIIFLTAHWGG